MLGDLRLPDGVTLVRTTPAFDAATMPEGLRRAHRVAPDVWGVLRVLAGEVTYVVEATNERRVVGAGHEQVIPPDVEHHVEPGPGARFEVAFYR